MEGEFSKFLKEYRETFKKNFIKLTDRYLTEKEEFTKFWEILFNQLLKEEISKDILYNLALNFAKRGQNIRIVILKLLWFTLFDFIGYLTSTKEEPSKEELVALKKFLNTIENILEVLDKVYTEYYEKLSKVTEELVRKSKREKKLMLKELELLKIKGTSLTFVFSYKELPIYCKGNIKDIFEDVIEIEFSEKCIILPILKESDFFYIKSEDLTDTIKLEVLQKKENKIVARAVSYEENYIEKRKYVRVVLKEYIVVHLKEKDVSGVILDISVGGIGVFLKHRDIEKGEVTTLKFSLMGNEIEIKGECRYVIEYREGYKTGFMFISLPTIYENIIGQYVMQRQLEILKELKTLA